MAAKQARLRQLIAATHQHAADLLRRLAALRKLNASRRTELAHLSKPPVAKPAAQIVMYDSVDVGTVPANATAVAGYTSGNWPTYKALVAKFPHAKHLSIAVSASHDADCLDIEAGDARPDQAPAWFTRQRARGVKRPCLYASLSVMPAVQRAMNAAHIPRNAYRLWVAEYTYKPHIPPGFDACQWTDKALGRNLDESLCSPTFFD